RLDLDIGDVAAGGDREFEVDRTAEALCQRIARIIRRHEVLSLQLRFGQYRGRGCGLRMLECAGSASQLLAVETGIHRSMQALSRAADVLARDARLHVGR